MAQSAFDPSRHKWRLVTGEPELSYKVRHDSTSVRLNFRVVRFNNLAPRLPSKSLMNLEAIAREIFSSFAAAEKLPNRATAENTFIAVSLSIAMLFIVSI